MNRLRSLPFCVLITIGLFFTILNHVEAYNTCATVGATINCPVAIFTGNTVGSNDNASSGAGTCNSVSVGTGGQHWFKFISSNCGNSQVTVSTDFGPTTFDTKIHVYSGTCGNLTCVTADDDSGSGSNSLCTFTATGGTIYFIRIGGFGTAQGNFFATVACGGVGGCNDPAACNYNPTVLWNDCTCSYPPSNDVCINAFPLAINYDYSVNTTCTVMNGPDPSCGGTEIKDLWYKFVYEGGTITIYTVGGSLADTRLVLYDGCNGNIVACNDDTFLGLESRLLLGCDFGLIQGHTYYLQSGGFSYLAGTYDLFMEKLNVTGCTNPSAINYHPCANVNDGSCQFCVADLNGDQAVNVADLLIFTSQFGSTCY